MEMSVGILNRSIYWCTQRDLAVGMPSRSASNMGDADTHTTVHLHLRSANPTNPGHGDPHIYLYLHTTDLATCHDDPVSHPQT